MKWSLLLLLTITTGINAQQHFELPLWLNDAPNDNGLTGPEKGVEENKISNVSEPVIMVYLPKESNGLLLPAPVAGIVTWQSWLGL